MTTATTSMVNGADVLSALILCGLMGVLGQGVRAAVGLKSANSLAATPTASSQFSAAYFALSLMIGFIAGVTAGLALGLQNFIHIDLTDTKLLLGIAASGYAGADFIENSLSLFLPASSTPKPTPAIAAPATSTAPAAPAALVAFVESTPAAVIVPDGSAQLAAALSVAAPGIDRAKWIAPLLAGFAKYDVSTNRRKAVALGQFLVEAGASFQEVTENLNYIHAERLAEVFPREFPTVESAQSFLDGIVGNRAEAIGNRVYANKLGNGDEQSGDGYRFRGRGLIQLTGRDEYTEFGATIGKNANEAAAYCETAEGAAVSGCWYLSSRGCLPLADAWEIPRVTRKVNGAAMLGNAQRIAYAESILKQLGN